MENTCLSWGAADSKNVSSIHCSYCSEMSCSMVISMVKKTRPNDSPWRTARVKYQSSNRILHDIMIHPEISGKILQHNPICRSPTGRPTSRCTLSAACGAGAGAIGKERGRGSAGGTEPGRSIGDGGVSGWRCRWAMESS